MTLRRTAAFIDLGSVKIEVKEIPLSLRESYLGGRGIDIYLMYTMLKPHLDPWDPGNLLLIGAGILSGTPAPSAAGMIHVGGKLPLTGLAGSLSMGGFWGAELRFAGFDHLVITGKSSRPVYLWIHNREIEIRDAAPFWNADSLAVQDLIRDISDEENAQVMSVGKPGGDRGAPTDLRTDGEHCREAAELGILMLSKNLKAVAVRGTLPVEIKNPDKALQHLAELIDLSRLSADRGCPSLTERNDGSPEESPWLNLYHTLENVFGHSGVSPHDSAGEDTVRRIFRDECLHAVADALGIGGFPRGLLSPEMPAAGEVYSHFLAAVTGISSSPEELMRTGERIVTLERLFDIREGFSLADDGPFTYRHRCLPEFSPLLKPALARYNEIHGWDMHGRPQPDTLKRLGLDGELHRLL